MTCVSVLPEFGLIKRPYARLAAATMVSLPLSSGATSTSQALDAFAIEPAVNGFFPKITMS